MSEKTKRFYVGSCQSLKPRILKHNSGQVKSTKSGIPWKLVYSEEYPTRREAYKRELQIKSYKSGEAFRKLIK
ncbi:MAG: endonuclease [Candidatus Levybacteria bacterium RIFOXYA1_FULL_41_10]|uniref:Excinuclease abc c subunit domain protein n=1 Tax=Candidatus Gottesmanbacteria bacterium GW2011_GWB1_44_11c TaxID=1618447 RepID=A0A0G1GRL7_9BACT|nr:MAG: Excinuclease abc c subunit domain protein [Candidatus Levybacteria bacterium GW2011_GWA1_39_32]KKR50479.1 MAG: Excinuclease abc c subunit domain protein [Candidatus Levybacteria bacterium GW2011_GWC1_40_19]KKR71187.1 MAG: Excinuclease abc c subunit domain protein [Candidatus Levybacteria bacterium GW2011_GWC2_40_7]KKR95171.1 MAG: Excinuclease abc c subunit domain protein [Candidatus Levybacteria bacterium GW2011_GWA2_41_15]KKT37711.1 MAG: Excinuclease abc c subunit domain protein [Candi